MVVNNYIFIATWIRYQLQNGNSLISKTKLEMNSIHCQDLRYMVSLSYAYIDMKNNNKIEANLLLLFFVFNLFMMFEILFSLEFFSTRASLGYVTL